MLKYSRRKYEKVFPLERSHKFLYMEIFNFNIIWFYLQSQNIFKAVKLKIGCPRFPRSFDRPTGSKLVVTQSSLAIT